MSLTVRTNEPCIVTFNGKWPTKVEAEEKFSWNLNRGWTINVKGESKSGIDTESVELLPGDHKVANLYFPQLPKPHVGLGCGCGGYGHDICGWWYCWQFWVVLALLLAVYSFWKWRWISSYCKLWREELDAKKATTLRSSGSHESRVTGQH
jgi:hypothetical protein